MVVAEERKGREALRDAVTVTEASEVGPGATQSDRTNRVGGVDRAKRRKVSNLGDIAGPAEAGVMSCGLGRSPAETRGHYAK